MLVDMNSNWPTEEESVDVVGRGARPVEVCASGGGQRAALLSGGAVLALRQLADAGDVRVDRWSSTSGSSLLMARLMCSDLSLRDEITHLAKNGFSPKHLYWPVVIASVLFAFASALVIDAALGTDQPPILFYVTVISPLIYFFWLRFVSFSLRRGVTTGWRRRLALRRRNSSMMCADAERSEVARTVPLSGIQFAATEVETSDRQLVWLAPSDVEESIEEVALASSAFPFAVGNRTVDGRTFADGGFRSNSALASALEAPPVLGAALLSVDASTGHLPSPVLKTDSGGSNRLVGSTVRKFAPAASFLLGAIIVGRFVAAEWFGLISSLVFMVLVLVGVGRLLWSLMSPDVRRFLSEGGHVSILFEAQRELEVQKLSEQGATPLEVNLGEPWDGATTSDFPTRLAALHFRSTQHLLTRGFERTLDVLCVACGESGRRCPRCESWCRDHSGWVDELFHTGDVT